MAEKAEKKSKRINVEIAPGIRRALDAFLEREKLSPKRTKVNLTYTDLVNLSLEKYFAQRPKD